MASLRRALAQRFLHIAKIRSTPAAGSGNASVLRRLFPGGAGSSSSGEDSSLLRSLLQPPSIRQAIPPDRLPAGGRVIGRIGIDALLPPPSSVPQAAAPEIKKGITVEEARKAARASQMEVARSRLRAETRACVSYSEFVRICSKVSSPDMARGLARSLDEAGVVIVFGDAVFLRPEEVAKAIEKVIPSAMTCRDDPGMKELRKMEEKKAEIDRRAAALVRRELWLGLGYMVVQTAAFMRLTFWELSWDVMEPICFYVTSIYCMAGYAFFLRTAKEPSFEGFFESRFGVKQKRLMKADNFDLGRFNELRRAYPGASSAARSVEYDATPPSSYCDCHRKCTLIGEPQ